MIFGEIHSKKFEIAAKWPKCKLIYLKDSIKFNYSEMDN